AKLGLPMPKTWDDLLDPKLSGEIQLPDPRSSGTTFTAMATFISLMGEEKAFEYLKKLDQNISQYPKSNL
ncbi:ABC transporter substrate-binding protein, partial [Escherichia coli]